VDLGILLDILPALKRKDSRLRWDSVVYDVTSRGLTPRQFTPSKAAMRVPTLCENMPTVDSKGRIVLPHDVRKQLGIELGIEVEVREEDGKAIVEPEDDPEKIIDRMEELIAETSPASTDTLPFENGRGPIAQKHRDAIRRGAEQTDGD